MTNNTSCTITVKVFHEIDGGKQLVQTHEISPNSDQDITISAVAYFGKKRYYTYYIEFYSPGAQNAGEPKMIINHKYVMRNEWTLAHNGPWILEYSRDISCPGCWYGAACATNGQADHDDLQYLGSRCSVDYTID